MFYIAAYIIFIDYYGVVMKFYAYILSMIVFLSACASNYSQISEEECEKNSKVTFLVLNIKDDSFGAQSYFENVLRSKCYNVINHYSTEVPKDIDDALKMGEMYDADFVIFGAVWKKYFDAQIQSVYLPNYINPNALPDYGAEGFWMGAWRAAKELTGYYVCGRLFRIEIKSKKMEQLYSGDALFKFSD